MTVLLSIWEGEEQIRSYRSPMVPRVGDVLVLGYAENVRVTGVILSFCRNERPDDDELNCVSVYVVPDPTPDFVPR